MSALIIFCLHFLLLMLIFDFFFFFFFFSSRRRHTISKRDWSSDVCSSDLVSRCQRSWLTQPFRYCNAALHRCSPHFLCFLRSAPLSLKVSRALEVLFISSLSSRHKSASDATLDRKSVV